MTTPASNTIRAAEAIKEAVHLLDLLASATEGEEINHYALFLFVRLLQNRLNMAWDALQPRPDTEAP